MVQPLFSEEENLIVSRNRPHIVKGAHPVESGRYLIPTNEINRLFHIVSSWIQNRAPGGIVYGRPRLGKSRAINYLMYVLPTEYLNIPVFFFRSRQYRFPSENMFFEDLLHDIGHAIIRSGKANAKRDRFVRFLIERTNTSGQNRMIFFLDDAQRLTELHYGWLMDIYNELDSEGISLTVILVGQNELLDQRSSFHQGKKMQIIGRFMVHEYKFTGIKDVSDLRYCLEGYDEGSEFPEKSGWSYTRYFFPEKFDLGMRLADYAEELFEVFVELQQEEGLRAATEIPMQYLTLTIDYILRRYGVNGEDVDRITKIHWKEAIRKSGYIEAEKYQD